MISISPKVLTPYAATPRAPNYAPDTPRAAHPRPRPPSQTPIGPPHTPPPSLPHTIQRPIETREISLRHAIAHARPRAQHPAPETMRPQTARHWPQRPAPQANANRAPQTRSVAKAKPPRPCARPTPQTPAPLGPSPVPRARKFLSCAPPGTFHCLQNTTPYPAYPRDYPRAPYAELSQARTPSMHQRAKCQLGPAAK
eukprot:4024876-Pyramimonas_sp.AAC.1